MIYDALIVPTETPATLREIKRALLTYDKVFLLDPSDRELFPRQAFTMAVSGLPFGMDTGPVRPMGKDIGYDDRFDHILKICHRAVLQGSIKVISTYNSEETVGFSIGGVPMGDYPLRPAQVYRFYRALASSQELLTDVLGDDSRALQQELQITDGLALIGGADGSTNGGPILPIADTVAASNFAEPLTQIARARIAAIIKYSGYCEAKELIPVFGAPHYVRAMERILRGAQEFFDDASPENQFRQSRVLDLIHGEFLVDERLERLSIEEVLKLRTSAWGKQAAARERMFQYVFEIAKSAKSEEEFSGSATKRIQEYRRASEKLLRERASLQMSIKCDLGIGALTAGTVTAGILSQVESTFTSVAATLAAGGVWALTKAKEYRPKLADLIAQKDELKRGAGFALHDFYSRLPPGR